MYRKAKDVTLKSGEAAELGIVQGPDGSEIALNLRALLGHKGKRWQWQIEQSLGEVPQPGPSPEGGGETAAGGVESRFYILSHGGKPFSNIMVVERGGIGIFGHVYTDPQQRRKGAAELLNAFLMEDFKRRGGQALYLGTAFDTPQYHLYARHGFQSVEPGSDCMCWFAQSAAEFEARVFARGSVRQEALAFAHWPTLPALAMMRHPARIRIAGMDVLGPGTTEGGSLTYLAAMQGKTTDKKELGAKAVVAVSENSGVPVAIACVRPDPIFAEQVGLLDLFCAPGFEAQLPGLFLRLEIPEPRAVLSHADPFWPEKMDILRACGLARSHTLRNALKVSGAAHDIEVWIR